MIAVKTQAIDLVKALPEKCSWEDIQYHIYVRDKVEKGLIAMEKGQFVTQAEVERRLEEWLKPSGQNHQ